jgi:hypothetical protein
MSDQNVPVKPDRQKFDNLPIIFHFQPTSYEVVTPDRLGEWERLMTERVGITGDVSVARGPSISFCGASSGGTMEDPCDSDYLRD